MNVKDVLRKIGIVFDGEYSKDGSYVIDLFDSNQYGKEDRDKTSFHELRHRRIQLLGRLHGS